VQNLRNAERKNPENLLFENGAKLRPIAVTNLTLASSVDCEVLESQIGGV
jgi:hypothetical protein